MRLILIIITLLGAIITGYSLSADEHLESSVMDLVQVVYPTWLDVDMSPKASEFMRRYDALTYQHHRDAFVVAGFGVCIFILGFVGLVIHGRQHKMKQPNTALEPTASAPSVFDREREFGRRAFISHRLSARRGSALDR